MSETGPVRSGSSTTPRTSKSNGTVDYDWLRALGLCVELRHSRFVRRTDTFQVRVRVRFSLIKSGQKEVGLIELVLSALASNRLFSLCNFEAG